MKNKSVRPVKALRVRFWVDVHGKKFFGPGRAELLQLIHDTGSIARAAGSMGMSYKKAWAMVREMNTRGSKPYVELQKGGEQGGGATLTAAGRKVLAAYQKLAVRLETVAGKDKNLLDQI